MLPSAFLQQAVLPYTFTTAELDALKTKLAQAENHITSSTPRTKLARSAVVPMSMSEVRTLLKMIDMTYLQGLSAGGYLGSNQTTPIASPLATAQADLTATLNLQAALAAQAPHQTSMNNVHLSRGVPKGNYVCHKCGIPGHYIQDCPKGQSTNPTPTLPTVGSVTSVKGPPPHNYVCHKCNKPGHWIQECPLSVGGNTDYTKPPPPNYVCHRCFVRGHWIKNCPTNGDRTFDSKQPLKSTSGVPTTVTSTVVNDNNTATNSENGEPPSKKRRIV